MCSPCPRTGVHHVSGLYSVCNHATHADGHGRRARWDHAKRRSPRAEAMPEGDPRRKRWAKETPAGSDGRRRHPPGTVTPPSSRPREVSLTLASSGPYARSIIAPNLLYMPTRARPSRPSIGCRGCGVCTDRRHGEHPCGDMVGAFIMVAWPMKGARHAMEGDYQDVPATGVCGIGQ